MRTLPTILAAALATALAAPAAHAADPIDGTWDLDPAASKFDPGPARTADTRTYRVEGDTIHLTGTGAYEDGTPIDIRFAAVLDGKDYPAIGNPKAETIAQVRVDTHTVRTTTKRHGVVTATSTRTVSQDGKTMTITTSGTDEKGVAFDNLLVFRKRETP